MDAFDRLSPALQYQIVNGLGWSGLRPVQEESIDAILDGNNCVVLAPTAGGKTEAAFFPLLSVMDTEDLPGTSVLYIAPIRALLNNQEARLERLTGLLGRRAFKWHGDVGASARKRKASNTGKDPEQGDTECMRSGDVYSLVVKSGVRTALDVQVMAASQAEKGDTCLAEFCTSCGRCLLRFVVRDEHA